MNKRWQIADEGISERRNQIAACHRHVRAMDVSYGCSAHPEQVEKTLNNIY
jgi:hypothetical protein